MSQDMKLLKNVSASILIGAGRGNEPLSTIQVYDETSNIIITEIKLTNDQLAAMLSRTVHTPVHSCLISKNLEHLGKVKERKELLFCVPDSISRDDTQILSNYARETADEGWTAECYFGAQNSFNYAQRYNGLKQVRTTQYRWVEEKQGEELS